MQDLLRAGLDSFGHIDEFALDSRTRPNEPNYFFFADQLIRICPGIRIPSLML